MTDAVHDHVVRLAAGKPVDYKIGSRYTGRREYLWDSRAGVYSESLPLLGYDEWLIQMAMAPSRLARRRIKKEIRQPY